MNGQSVRRMAFAQIFHDIAVDFDYVEMLEALQQGQGQCTETRSDLDEPVTGSRADGRHHLFDDPLVLEEMLPKPLARSTHFGQPAIASAANTMRRMLRGHMRALRTGLVDDTMWRLVRRMRANVPALSDRRGRYRSSSRNST